MQETNSRNDMNLSATQKNLGRSSWVASQKDLQQAYGPMPKGAAQPPMEQDDFNVTRRLFILAQLSLFLVFWGEMGRSAPLDYSIRKADDGSSCSVILSPSIARGTHPPRFMLTILPDETVIRFSIDTPVNQTIELVARNMRTQFTPFTVDLKPNTKDDPLWVIMKNSILAGEKFYLTRNSKGASIESAGYDVGSADDLFRPLKYSCDPDNRLPISDSIEDLLRKEQALLLSFEDINHIRVVLAAETGSIISNSTPILTDRDRDALEMYSDRISGKAEKYLNERLAKELLAKRIILKQPSDADLGVKVTRNGDWRVYEDAEATRCEISTGAFQIKGEALSAAPQMRFAAIRAESGDSLWIDLISPNHFSSSKPIKAKIDGNSFDLSFDPVSGSVRPAILYENIISREVLIAMRVGRNIEVIGTGLRTNKPLSIKFSAIGFELAISQMAKNCNREGLVKWIE